jgi:hypothetical protein
VTAQPARPAEISDLIAWAARLASTGPGGASTAEVAAYLTAKANLLDRIAASRDIQAARQAAAGAADAAARAAGTTHRGGLT